MTCLLLLSREAVAGSAAEGWIENSTYTVPLTLDADQALSELGAPRRDLNELVAHERVCRLGELAQEALEHWSAAACGGETLDGIDWPALFISQQQQLFLGELLMGWELAARLRERGCRHVVLAGAGAPDPYDPRFAFVAALRAGLGETLTVATGPSQGGATAWSGWRSRAQSRWRVVRSLAHRLRPDSSRRTVVGVFAHSEWQRFTGALLELRSVFGPRFALWSLGLPSRDLRRWAAGADIAVTGVLYPRRISPDVESFSAAHWQRWRGGGRQRLAIDAGCTALAAEELTPSFELWFTYTLPHTIEWGRTLRQRLRAARPDWLVGSSESSYASSFPFCVAAGESIPSVALSHTYVPGDSFPIHSSYLACRNHLERQGYRRSLPEDDRVLYCRDACNPISYAAHSTLSLPTRGRRIVALLTASPGPVGLALPWVDLTDFREVLSALLQPPGDLADLDFAIKAHPRLDVTESIRHRPKAENVFVLPGLDPVLELLRVAWVVVVFNHYGSVVADAVGSGKPILFLDSGRFCMPDVELHAFAAGEVLHSLPQLWRSLARLRDSPDAYDELRDRVQRFAAAELAPAAGTIAEALQRISSRR